MSESNTNIIILPNYLNEADDQTKHLWRQWDAISRKIDNHPERYYDIVNRETGAVRTMDCKGSVGLVLKWAKEFNASEQELSDLNRITVELQKLKAKKGQLNKEWSKKVFGNRKKGSSENTVLDLRQNELIDLFSKFYSVTEIKKIIQDKWNMIMSADTIKAFYIDHKEKIDKLKADYLLSGKELRFATDMGRLEVLSKLAWEMERKFEKSKGLEVSKELRAIVEQIRKEVKGEEIRLTIEGKIDINATIQANQTLHEALQKLPINMLVIGLTAAKQQLNPASLIGMLANSYYSKFNGFNKLAEKSELQLPGQYIKSYNWEEIRIRNEQTTVDTEAIEVFEEKITPRDKIEVAKSRQKMMELLDSFKDQVK